MPRFIEMLAAFGPWVTLAALTLVLLTALAALLIAGKERDADVKVLGMSFTIKNRKKDGNDGPPQLGS